MAITNKLRRIITAPPAGAGVPPVGGEDYFADQGSTSTVYANSTWPSAFRSAVANKTFMLIENYLYSGASKKVVRAYMRDHGASAWLTGGIAFEDISTGTGTQPEADDHGVGGGCLDYQGHVHAFGGTHNVALIHSSSNSPYDVSAFTVRSADLGPDAYPHPVAIGSALWLFTRYHPDMDTFDLSLRKTTALSGGVATWGARETVLTLGYRTRAYVGQVILDGTDIYVILTRGDFGDTIREHVYGVRIDTLTGTKSNFARTKTDAGTISAADMEGSYKLVQLATDHETVTPSMCIEGNRIHVVWNDGIGATGTLRHRYYDKATGAQSGVTDLVTIANPRAQGTITINSSGVECMWEQGTGAVPEYINNDEPARAPTTGGDIYLAKWTLANGWSTATLVRSATRSHKLASPNAVFNAHPDFRWTFAERSAEVAYRLGGNLRSFAYGDSGIIKREWTDEAEVAAYAGRLSVPPTTDRRRRLNALVRVLKSCGAYGLSDAIYIGAGSASLADALKNLKSTSWDQTAVGTIALDGPKGPKGDGISGYSDTGYNPVSSGGQLTATNAHILSWVLTEGQNDGYEFGIGSLVSYRMRARSVANTNDARAANTTALTRAETSALGEFGVRRNGPNATGTGSLLNDGQRVTTATLGATDVAPTGNLMFHKSAALFSSRAHGIDSFGALLPDDVLGVAYQAKKRFLIEEGVV